MCENDDDSVIVICTYVGTVFYSAIPIFHSNLHNIIKLNYPNTTRLTTLQYNKMPPKKYNKSKGNTRKNAMLSTSKSLVVKNGYSSKMLNQLSSHLQIPLSRKQTRRAMEVFTKMMKCKLDDIDAFISSCESFMLGGVSEEELERCQDINLSFAIIFMSTSSDNSRWFQRSCFNLWLWEDGTDSHHPFSRQRNFGWFCIIHLLVFFYRNDNMERNH